MAPAGHRRGYVDGTETRQFRSGHGSQSQDVAFLFALGRGAGYRPLDSEGCHRGAGLRQAREHCGAQLPEDALGNVGVPSSRRLLECRNTRLSRASEGTSGRRRFRFFHH